MNNQKPAANPFATIVAIVVLIVVVVAVCMPRPRSYDTPTRVWCASNLKQIGQAILLYANENKGATPDSFSVALQTQDLVPDVFVCRSTSTEKAANNDSFLAEPDKHCDYIYVGDRLPMPNDHVPEWAVIAFDRERNHHGDGVNVLFGDGHVEFLLFSGHGKPTPWWDGVQAQIARGDRPILLPASATQPVR